VKVWSKGRFEALVNAFFVNLLVSSAFSVNLFTLRCSRSMEGDLLKEEDRTAESAYGTVAQGELRPYHANRKARLVSA
jgi:hypothetical protein